MDSPPYNAAPFRSQWLLKLLAFIFIAQVTKAMQTPSDRGSHRQRPAIKKTFTDILRSQPSEAQNRIGRYRGFPAVSFTPDEVISLSIPYQFALVGRFLKSRPPLEVIRKSFEQIGFKPGFTVGLLSPSLILINFECTIDYQRCFSRRLWNNNGSQMVVTKWTPSFHADSESSVFPVWVSLTHLPIHLQEAKALHSIASSIGHPLMMDASTAAKTRPSMARFCVEIDISKDLLKKIWIDNGGLGFFQPVTYEKLPEFCIQCKKSGHLDGKCSSMDNLISKNELSKNNLSKTWCPISKHEVSKENLPKTAAVMIEPILNIPCELGPKLDNKTSCDMNVTDPSTAGHKKSEVDHHVSDLSPDPKGDELTPQEDMEINLTAFCKEDNPNTQALNVQSDFPTDSHNDVQNSSDESGKELLTTNTAAVVNQDGVCDPTDATVSYEVDEQSEAEAQYDMEKLTKEADLEHTQEQIIEESMDGMTAQNAYCVGNTINLDEFPVLTRQNIEEDVHTPTENVETGLHTPTEIEKDDTTGTITLMAEDTTKETTSPNIPDTNIGSILHSFELEGFGHLNGFLAPSSSSLTYYHGVGVFFSSSCCCRQREGEMERGTSQALSNTIRFVGLLGSHALGSNPRFMATAVDLGRELVRRKIRLTYGGGNVGLQGAVASTVYNNGGRVRGFIPGYIATRGVYGPTYGAEYTVSSNYYKYFEMNHIVKAFIVLPGGIDTIEGLFTLNH
ncbi:unnamed protein product [Cuscuta campestris]|uniref:DUF4283 domain-containing protein n=1 Tax=Cuscuta campestris TaxID=132261 RepID=A0A484MCL9_9ASTE|nr:unnamed protein product [Cuscuta campestris]